VKDGLRHLRLISFIFAFMFFKSFGSFAQNAQYLPYSQKQVEQLSIETAYHFAENLYPLGGYDGFNLGAGYSYIQLSPESQKDRLDTIELSIEKGLYYNVDMFFSMLPIYQVGNLSGFGGGLRWQIYELQKYPIHFSMALSGKSTNLSNSVIFITQSADFFSQWSWSQIFLYLGFGQTSSKAQFAESSLNPANPNSTAEHFSHFRSLLAGGIQSQIGTLAIELSQSQTTSLTLKWTSRGLSLF